MQGYSVHSAVAISVWEKLLNCLIECFTNELGEIELLDKLPMLIDSKILIDFYGEHFYRIKDRIPSIRYSDGHENMSLQMNCLIWFQHLNIMIEFLPRIRLFVQEILLLNHSLEKNLFDIFSLLFHRMKMIWIN